MAQSSDHSDANSNHNTHIYQCSVCGQRSDCFSNTQRNRAAFGEPAKCKTCAAEAAAKHRSASSPTAAVIATVVTVASSTDQDSCSTMQSPPKLDSKKESAASQDIDSMDEEKSEASAMTINDNAHAADHANNENDTSDQPNVNTTTVSIPRKKKADTTSTESTKPRLSSSLLDHAPPSKSKVSTGTALWSREDEEMMEEARDHDDHDDECLDNEDDGGHDVSLNALKQKILGRKIVTAEDLLLEQQQELSSSPSPDDTKRYNLTTTTTNNNNNKWIVPPDLLKELSCAICHDPLYQPVSLHCGHSFCGPCLHWWMDHYRNNITNSHTGNHHDDSVSKEGQCPTCRRPILLQGGPESLGVNTALRECVTALMGEEWQQRQRQTEERARRQQEQKQAKGEHGGAHSRGYQVLTTTSEESWRTLEEIRLLKDKASFVKGRRSIVLDADDQRMQLALSLWTGIDNFVDRQGRRHVSKPIRYDRDEGILHASICLLSMEEDEAAEGDGFPLQVQDEDDFVCSHESRWVHSSVEATAQVVTEEGNDSDKDDEEVADVTTVQHVPLARRGFGSDGLVHFEVALAESPELQRAKLLRFRHEESGSVLEIQLPPNQKLPSRVTGQQTQPGIDNTLARSSVRTLDDYEDDDEIEFVQEENDDYMEEEEDGTVSSDEGEEEDLCTICRKHGELMICDGGDYLEGCLKNFHISCVNRSVIPDGDWVCERCAADNPEALLDFEGEVGIDGFEFPANKQVYAYDTLARKRKQIETVVVDSDDEEFGSPPKKAAGKSCKHIGDDSDSDDFAVVSNSDGAKKASKRVCVIDSDDDDE